MLAISLAIALESKGEIIFKQRRVGRDGKLFTIYKFRTMYQSAPSYSYKPENGHDSRITRVGRLLRKTSLDELPQLVNVLKGDMSLVGPRPEMPFIVNLYEPWQHQRHNVLPGITGYWQVFARSLGPMHEHGEYDVYYVKHQSALLDITLMIQTVYSVLTTKGAI